MQRHVIPLACDLQFLDQAWHLLNTPLLRGKSAVAWRPPRTDRGFVPWNMDWEASLKRDEFVDLVKAKLFEALHEKQMLESVAIEYDPRSFTLYVHNKAKDTALHPVPVELAQPHYAYNNHAAQPAERQALVAELVDEAKTRVAMQFWEVVRDRVYPLIRPTEFVDEWRRAHKDAKNKKHCVMVCSRLDDLEQLKVGYVVEQGDALAPVTLAVLEDWGVDLARLEATALENLRRLHRESAAHLSEKDFKKKVLAAACLLLTEGLLSVLLPLVVPLLPLAALVFRDESEEKGPRRRPQQRVDRRLEEVAEAVGGGYCRLQMPLRPALAVRGTVAGHRLCALKGGGGGLHPAVRLYPVYMPCVPCTMLLMTQVLPPSTCKRYSYTLYPQAFCERRLGPFFGSWQAFLPFL